jgi:hypothetical protein
MSASPTRVLFPRPKPQWVAPCGILPGDHALPRRSALRPHAAVEFPVLIFAGFVQSEGMLPRAHAHVTFVPFSGLARQRRGAMQVFVAAPQHDRAKV